MSRILASIASNWMGLDGRRDRLAAQVQALGLAYLAECRPGTSGGPANDGLTSAVLGEFVVSSYPIPALQMVTPIGFSFSNSADRLASLMVTQLYGHDPVDEALAKWIHDLAAAISQWQAGVCAVSAGDSYDTFLRKKALSVIRGFTGRMIQDFPGTVTRVDISERAPRPVRDILVLGGCDLSRIANAAQYSLSRCGIASTWWEDLLRVPAGFLALRLARDETAGAPEEVRRALAKHLGPIFLNNIRQVGPDWPFPRPLCACVISVDGDIHKRLHEHRATGALVHFPPHWGGPLSNLVGDVPAFKQWIDAEWRRLPPPSITEVIDSLERLFTRFIMRYDDIRFYVVNANQIRPRHMEYDPALHGDPVEGRCRAFNGALRELSARRGIKVLDFSLYARRGGLDHSKDIRHVRNAVYDWLGDALAADLRSVLTRDTCQ